MTARERLERIRALAGPPLDLRGSDPATAPTDAIILAVIYSLTSKAIDDPAAAAAFARSMIEERK